MMMLEWWAYEVMTLMAGYIGVVSAIKEEPILLGFGLLNVTKTRNLEPMQSVFSDYLLFIDPGVLFNYLDRVCGQGHQLFQNFVRAAQNRIDY